MARDVAINSSSVVRPSSTPLRGFILDMDGTVYLSDRALQGAVETIAALRQRGLGVVFLSNKPLEPGAAYAAKLTALGIPTLPEDVITSGYVLSHHLAQIAPARACLSSASRRSGRNCGRRVCGLPKNPPR